MWVNLWVLIDLIKRIDWIGYLYDCIIMAIYQFQWHIHAHIYTLSLLLLLLSIFVVSNCEKKIIVISNAK